MTWRSYYNNMYARKRKLISVLLFVNSSSHGLYLDAAKPLKSETIYGRGSRCDQADPEQTPLLGGAGDGAGEDAPHGQSEIVSIIVSSLSTSYRAQDASNKASVTFGRYFHRLNQ